jgi:hypothetical protein
LSVYLNNAALTTNLFSGRSEWNIRASHQTKNRRNPTSPISKSDVTLDADPPS